MFGSEFLRHIKEFRQYIRGFKYERSDSGFYFPTAKIGVSGFYTHWVTGYESELAVDKNLIVDQGLNHMLDVIMYTPGTQTTVPAWYLMLHSGTGDPAWNTTASNYGTSLTEIVSNSDGYAETTRREWVPDAVDTGNTEIINDTSSALFTIATPDDVTVNGAGLVSVSTKGATSGILMSAGKFAAARTLNDTDEFNLKYKVDFDAV